MKNRLGIITSYEITHNHIFKNGQLQVVDTPYGPVDTHIGECNGEEVIHMTRSGRGHPTPPHLINHRGNISALSQLGVTEIISLSMVGSLVKKYPVGSLVLLDQLLDFTKCHPRTLYSANEFAFVDMTNPFCPEMRGDIMEICRRRAIEVHPSGCYVCVDGPRFETKAEIRMFQVVGADLIGMTIAPECIYAREAGICYATISGVVNMGAGMETDTLNSDEIQAVRDKHKQNMIEIIKNYIESDRGRKCNCGLTSPKKQYKKEH